MSRYKLVRARVETAARSNGKDTEFYAEKDEDTGDWCVFGDNTGKAYESYSSKAQAEARAKERNKAKKTQSSVETAADAGDKWWKSLDKKQQDQYLKLHPNSKYGKKKDKAPEAPKTKAKPAVVPKKLSGPKLKKATNPAVEDENDLDAVEKRGYYIQRSTKKPASKPAAKKTPVKKRTAKDIAKDILTSQRAMRAEGEISDIQDLLGDYGRTIREHGLTTDAVYKAYRELVG